MTKYFVQMSGVPGSGKSTIAHQLSRRIGAVVLDHDVTKSALLTAGISEVDAGRASYAVLSALSEQMLLQGCSVIFDSPCLYAELLQRGMAAAERHAANYGYIECQLTKLVELDQRLLDRSTKRSQIQHLDQVFSHAGGAPKIVRDLVTKWLLAVKRPQDNFLQIDTANAIEDCLVRAVAYVRGEASLP